MKSPFPGMDPYLEQYWGDVHTRLITYASDQLQEHLPVSLRARVEERVMVETENAANRDIYPDVRIEKRAAKHDYKPASSTAGITFAEPTIVSYIFSEPEIDRSIEIIDADSGNKVITVIEFLSLANKYGGKGQRLHRQKQEELFVAGVSLVEIDLLRGGKRCFMVPASKIPKRCKGTYQACVHRGWDEQKYEVYPMPLWEPLPTIKIPLRKKDKDAPLDLQALIELCYRNGRYDDINYRRPPDTPLDDEKEAAWTQAWLRARGLRK